MINNNLRFAFLHYCAILCIFAVLKRFSAFLFQTKVGSWPHPHTLGWQGLPGIKRSSLLSTFIKYDRKKFYRIAPRIDDEGTVFSTRCFLCILQIDPIS